MDSIPRSLRLLGVAVLAWPLWAFSHETAEIFARQGLSQDLCSTVNTASGSANLSQWQSLGLCSDFCIGQDYAFAIMQWQSCWCSNVAPAEEITTDVSRCSEGCPGYGEEENCGRRPNLYGYMRLPRQPTSTQGAESSTRTPTPSQAPPPPAVTETETVQDTVTVRPSQSTTSSSLESTPSSTDEDTRQQTTVVADGTVRTVFITPSQSNPTEAANSGAAGANSGSNSDSGLGTGAVVGIVVGVIAAVLALAGAVLFWFFRRRKQQKANAYDEPGSSQRGSSAGMISSSRNPEMVVTADNHRSDWVPNPASEQRRSRLMAVDPRMDPNGRPMYMRNKSHESVNTLHDDQDYSRKVARPVLRATNPDPSNDD